MADKAKVPTPLSDAIATAELLSRMTELCSLVVQRLDAGSVSPPQAQAPLRLNLPVPTFSGYTDKKSVADFLNDLTAYQTGTGLTYRLRRCDTGEETAPVHISDLKSYHLRDPDGEEPDSQPASLQDLDPHPVPGPASSRYNLHATTSAAFRPPCTFPLPFPRKPPGSGSTPAPLCGHLDSCVPRTAGFLGIPYTVGSPAKAPPGGRPHTDAGSVSRSDAHRPPPGRSPTAPHCGGEADPMPALLGPRTAPSDTPPGPTSPGPNGGRRTANDLTTALSTLRRLRPELLVETRPPPPPPPAPSSAMDDAVLDLSDDLMTL
ncbi:uncharacterized protein LOC135373653 [Ornithodoros turicata]|uniref:uncharacterized protein LOC135373653 n=1 Tax=Ornithodoros turicata TaxID=34597 RepID=UPI0031395B6E